MTTSRDIVNQFNIVNQFIKQINLKLEEMERGVYIDLNGCVLDLVKSRRTLLSTCYK